MSYLNATTGIVDAVTKVKDSHRGNLLLGIAMFLVGTTVVAVYAIRLVASGRSQMVEKPRSLTAGHPTNDRTSQVGRYYVVPWTGVLT